MTIAELESRLASAQAHLHHLSSAHRIDDEWESAYQVLLQAERDLAAAKGEEYAVPIDFPVKWDIGAPLPHLFPSDHDAYLTFYLPEPDPNWDGTYITIVDPSSAAPELLALVHFSGFTAVKMGDPNDEVFHGHPLEGKGLEGYTAQEVKNSCWLAELEKINSVHSLYNPENWRSRKHYVFWFHDNTVECVANSFTVEVIRESFSELLARICRRLIG